MNSAVERIDGGRCVYCNRYTVDAYFCEECAVESRYNASRFYDDARSPTGTQLGRALQRRVDCAAEHEQFFQMQTVTDAGVRPIENEERLERLGRSVEGTHYHARVRPTGGRSMMTVGCTEGSRSAEIRRLIAEHHHPRLGHVHSNPHPGVLVAPNGWVSEPSAKKRREKRRALRAERGTP